MLTLCCAPPPSGRKIRLGEENIDVFHDTLKADVALLASLNIMDYSLLVSAPCLCRAMRCLCS
jgi:hypothetical protein